MFPALVSAVHLPDARKSPTAVLLLWPRNGVLLCSHLREYALFYSQEISPTWLKELFTLHLWFLQKYGVTVNRADPVESLTLHIPVSVLTGLLVNNPLGTSQKPQSLPVLNKTSCQQVFPCV